MGCCLYVHTADGDEICLGRLYGYDVEPLEEGDDLCNDYFSHEELPSGRYLISIRKIRRNRPIGLGIHLEIALSEEQYREFARLYDEDSDKWVREVWVPSGGKPGRKHSASELAGRPGPKTLEWDG